MSRADITLIEDDTAPVICSACDGTGEAGRFGQLICRPCKGSGEVTEAVDDDYEDPRADGSIYDGLRDFNSDR